MKKDIRIHDEYITLGQLLKIADLVSTGGEEKYFLATNTVIVNDCPDNRRGRKLRAGDVIKIQGNEYTICQ